MPLRKVQNGKRKLLASAKVLKEKKTKWDKNKIIAGGNKQTKCGVTGSWKMGAEKAFRWF
jgi:hypothetical protein